MLTVLAAVRQGRRHGRRVRRQQRRARCSVAPAHRRSCASSPRSPARHLHGDVDGARVHLEPRLERRAREVRLEQAEARRKKEEAKEKALGPGAGSAAPRGARRPWRLPPTDPARQTRAAPAALDERADDGADAARPAARHRRPRRRPAIPPNDAGPVRRRPRATAPREPDARRRRETATPAPSRCAQAGDDAADAPKPAHRRDDARRCAEAGARPRRSPPRAARSRPSRPRPRRKRPRRHRDRRELGPIMRFAKYHGLGNDFLVVDSAQARRARRGGRPGSEAVTALCDRQFGVGGDGVLAVLPRDPGDRCADARAQQRRQRGRDVRQRPALRRQGALRSRRASRKDRARDRHRRRPR